MNKAKFARCMHAEGIIRRLLVVAISLLAMTATSRAAPRDVTMSGAARPLGAVMPSLIADHPPGNGVTVTLESSVRAPGLHDPTLSAFTVDLAPGGSAILHGTPSSFGYVLVHILSGAIHARAWNAGVGNYRAGETWVEPAFAYDITAENVSATEPARAFVVVVVP
jgi:quercetin dioxygenase-like cupin family protein